MYYPPLIRVSYRLLGRIPLSNVYEYLSRSDMVILNSSLLALFSELPMVALA